MLVKHNRGQRRRKLYIRKIYIYVDKATLSEKEIKELAGMLRGLANSIEGFKAVSGLENEKFIRYKRVAFCFNSVENAHYFKTCVEKYLDSSVLESLRAVKVFCRN